MTRPHVMIAPNGARRGKSDHPALPVTITETVKVAVACHAAGADALHLHVRDETGAHSLDTARYRDALAALQDRLPEMAVQITTESGGRFAGTIASAASFFYGFRQSRFCGYCRNESGF